MTEFQALSFFFRLFSNVSPELLCCRFFQSACLSTGATLLKLFFYFFFFAFFFFAFRRFWPRPRFFRPFSANLGLSRPFAPSSFLGKVGTFQSEFLPIFYPRHGNVFGGAKANVISITRGLAHTNTSLQHLQANIFTMPSSYFTPTFSHRDACLLFFHLLQHHWTPHLLPAPRACPHNLHNPPHKLL